MKHSICALCVAVFFGPALAADSERESAFESALYGIAEISHFRGDSTDPASLSSEMRANVLAAKSVLVETFKAVQKQDGDPRPYLSAALRKKFPTKGAFAAGVLDEEVSILALMVDDFEASRDGGQVVFRVSVILSAEGSITAMDRSATLQKVGKDWKLAEIK